MHRRIDIAPRESLSVSYGSTCLYRPVTIRVADESVQTIAELFLAQGNAVTIWPDEGEEGGEDEGTEVQDAEA